MRHEHDTHCLIDAGGTAVMCGTLVEMEVLEADCLALGHTQVSIRLVDDPTEWDWTEIDWGD